MGVSSLLAKAATLGKAAKKASRAGRQLVTARSIVHGARVQKQLASRPKPGTLVTTIKPYGPMRGLQRFFENGDRRVVWFKTMVLRAMAKELILQIKKRIPDTPEMKEYRDGWVAADVIGADKKEQGSAFLPTVFVGHRELSKKAEAILVDGVKVEFTWRDKKKPEPFEVKALRMYGPWTMTTLPYVPASAGWRPVVYNVSSRQVVEIEAKNKSESEGFVAYFAENNESMPPKGRGVEKFREKYVMDLSEYTLALEMGTKGLPRIPHLRPALRELGRTGIQKVLRKNPRLAKAVGDYRFSGWRTMKRDRRVSKSVIKTARRFQENLGKMMGSTPKPKIPKETA